MSIFEKITGRKVAIVAAAAAIGAVAVGVGVESHTHSSVESQSRAVRIGFLNKILHKGLKWDVTKMDQPGEINFANFTMPDGREAEVVLEGSFNKKGTIDLRTGKNLKNISAFFLSIYPHGVHVHDGQTTPSNAYEAQDYKLFFALQPTPLDIIADKTTLHLPSTTNASEIIVHSNTAPNTGSIVHNEMGLNPFTHSQTVTSSNALAKISYIENQILNDISNSETSL